MGNCNGQGYPPAETRLTVYRRREITMPVSVYKTPLILNSINMYRELLGCKTADPKQKCRNVRICTEKNPCCEDKQCLQECIQAAGCTLRVGSSSSKPRGSYIQLISVDKGGEALEEDTDKIVKLAPDVQLYWCAEPPDQGGCFF